MSESQNLKDTVRTLFSDYLKSTGHRQTPERFAILDAVYSVSGHFDVDELYSLMSQGQNFHVSRATLYNTMELLLDAHLVVRHQFGTISQYERSYRKEVHHHMVCTRCGKIREYQDEALRRSVEQARYPRFTMTHYSLYVYGLCSTCERALKKKKLK